MSTREYEDMIRTSKTYRTDYIVARTLSVARKCATSARFLATIVYGDGKYHIVNVADAPYYVNVLRYKEVPL